MFVKSILLFLILSNVGYIDGNQRTYSYVEKFQVKDIENINGECYLAMLKFIMKGLYTEDENNHTMIPKYLIFFLRMNNGINTTKNNFGDSIWFFFHYIKDNKITSKWSKRSLSDEDEAQNARNIKDYIFNNLSGQVDQTKNNFGDTISLLKFIFGYDNDILNYKGKYENYLSNEKSENVKSIVNFCKKTMYEFYDATKEVEEMLKNSLETGIIRETINSSIILNNYGGISTLLYKGEFQIFEKLDKESQYYFLVTLMNFALSDIFYGINYKLYGIHNNKVPNTQKIMSSDDFDILLTIKNMYSKVIELEEIIRKLLDKYNKTSTVIHRTIIGEPLEDESLNEDQKRGASIGYKRFMEYFKPKWLTIIQKYVHTTDRKSEEENVSSNMFDNEENTYFIRNMNFEREKYTADESAGNMDYHSESVGKKKKSMKEYKQEIFIIFGRLISNILDEDCIIRQSLKLCVKLFSIDYSNNMDPIINDDNNCLMDMNAWTILLINYGKNMMIEPRFIKNEKTEEYSEWPFGKDIKRTLYSSDEYEKDKNFMETWMKIDISQYKGESSNK